MASLLLLIFVSFSLPLISVAYRPGDIVPMSKMGQYHSSRTVWHDVIGKHCPIFAVNREVLIPIAKPTGYTGADPYKISFQVGKEKFLIPWLFLINRKSSEVPMIDMHLRYSGGDLHGVTAKIMLKFIQIFVNNSGILNIGLNMCLSDTPVYHGITRISQYIGDVSKLPLFVLKCDMVVMVIWQGGAIGDRCGIWILRSVRIRFVRETVAESSAPGVGVAKVE
ncbi:hypothetical protein QQP08_014260 [Theobroma cacao]|nr:hypothetical protein QQP08_014260 [Theobroma cacao]